MQVTRKLVAAAAIASVATLGLASVVSANMLDGATQQVGGVPDATSVVDKVTKDLGTNWFLVKGDGTLVAVVAAEVNTIQACRTVVPSDTKIPVKDVTGVVGIDAEDGTAVIVKTCDKVSESVNKITGGKWFKLSVDGAVAVSSKQVGPFRVCNNDIDLGLPEGELPDLSNLHDLSDLSKLGDLKSLLDLDLDLVKIGDFNDVTDGLKSCVKGAVQHN